MPSSPELKSLHVPAAYDGPPDGWTWARLDDVSEGVFDCPHSTPKLTAAGPFVVRTQDIITGVFRVDQAGRVSEETYKERIARVTPSRGDLLYSREGTYFGIAAEVPAKIRVCLGQRMVLIRPDKRRLDFSFLRHWLNSPIMAAHIHGYRDGTVAERLNLPTIRALPILIPPLPEQKAIASVLGALDDKIELNRRMNATLEAMARALFQSWFVDFDPVRAKLDGRQPPNFDHATAALFPETFEHDTDGLIPKGWRLGSVRDAFDLTMGQSPPGDTYNEEGNGIPFYQGRTDFGFRFPTRRMFCTAPTRYAKAGDTLVSVRAPVGDINMADEECCIGRGVAAVRHKSGATTFTYHAMANLYPDFAAYEAEGTVFGSINKQNFENLRCIIPPPNIVTAYERLAGPLDDQIRTLEHQSRTLATLRDMLLPKLLSGELGAPHTPLLEINS
jgi:type I restriction enzyme S subunit